MFRGTLHLLWTLGLIATLAAMAYFAFSPFHFHPKNDVSWIIGRPGLRFGDNGLVYARIPADGWEHTGSAGCTLQLWLRPAMDSDNNTVVGFYREDRPTQLRIGQDGDSLLVLNSKSQGMQWATSASSVEIEHFFDHRQEYFLTVRSGPSGTSVFRDGVQLKTWDERVFGREQCQGLLTIGNSAVMYDTWQGDLFGMGVFAGESSEPEIKAVVDDWKKGEIRQIAAVPDAVAVYSFQEGAGNIIRNEVRTQSTSNLEVPPYFSILRKEKLETPWNEFRFAAWYLRDLLVNIIGFVPFGFLLCGHLTWIWRIKRGVLWTTVFGLLLSLGIEIIQIYIPQRTSGMTDILMNVFGAFLGALLLDRGMLWAKADSWRQKANLS